MDITLLLQFLTASILLALMPGPDNIYVLTESITKGKRNGIILSLGLSSGVIVHTLLLATGVAALIKQSEYVFRLIKLLGALYLFYLAYLTYKEPMGKSLEISNESADTTNRESFFSLFKIGFLMNILNPKVTLFFLAFMPRFLCESCTVSYTFQFLVLGVTFMVQAFMIFSSIAILAHMLSKYLKSEVFWKNIKWIKLAVLVGLGVFLLF